MSHCNKAPPDFQGNARLYQIILSGICSSVLFLIFICYCIWIFYFYHQNESKKLTNSAIFNRISILILFIFKIFGFVFNAILFHIVECEEDLRFTTLTKGIPFYISVFCYFNFYYIKCASIVRSLNDEFLHKFEKSKK
jgi:hypothetical protein